MKRLLQMSLLLIVVCVLSGCASTYMSNRLQDSADIVTLTAGKNIGVKARVGSLHCGYFLGSDAWGLRGGRIGTVSKRTEEIDASLGMFILGCGGKEKYEAIYHKQDRKDYKVDYAYLFGIYDLHDNCPNRYLKPYYTDIHVAAGVGYGIRAGFNVGELLDFLLGWFCVDIYKDDTEEPREAPTQGDE